MNNEELPWFLSLRSATTSSPSFVQTHHGFRSRRAAHQPGRALHLRTNAFRCFYCNAFLNQNLLLLYNFLLFIITTLRHVFILTLHFYFAIQQTFLLETLLRSTNAVGTLALSLSVLKCCLTSSTSSTKFSCSVGLLCSLVCYTR